MKSELFLRDILMAESSVYETAKTIVSLYREQDNLDKEQYYVLRKLHAYLTESKPHLGEFVIKFPGSEVDIFKLSDSLFKSVIDKLNITLNKSNLTISYNSVFQAPLDPVIYATFYVKKII